MTARSSTGNFTHFGAYYKHKLQSMRTLIILNSIFALLSYPLMAGILIPYANVGIQLEKMRDAGLQSTIAYESTLSLSYSLESLTVASVFIGFMMLAAMFIMSYVICSKAFRWLYSKSIVDMDYSLPVSDDTRFFGDLLASFTGSFVPHILAILIGSGLYWCLPFKGLGAAEGEPAIMFGTLIQLVVTGLVACVMLMGISLLVMTLCGRAIEARIMPFVINAAIPAIHAICIVMMVRNMKGFDYSSNYEYSGIAASSPLGLLFMTIFRVVDSSAIESFRAVLFRADTFIPLLIVTIGVFAAAYLLVRFRRAERVGSPYVYPFVRTALSSIVTFAITLVFMLGILDEVRYSGLSQMSGVIVAMLVITFIVHLIMELVSGKGFKKFHISLLKYGCTMVISVVLCLVLFLSNGMGYARLVPETDDVHSVTIDLRDGSNFTDGNWYTTVEEEESITAVTDFHEQLLGQKLSESNDYRINISYRLKSGNTIARDYYLTMEQYLEAVGSVVSPEFYYRDRYEDQFPYGLFTDYANSTSRYECTTIFTNGTQKRVSLPMDELAEALRADCENLTYALLIGDTDIEKAPLELAIEIERVYSDGSSYNYTDSAYISVYSWQENTIALLESEGVKLFEDNTGKCRTLFAVKVPNENYGYSPDQLNVVNLMIAELKDQLSDEQLALYGYANDEYYEKVYYDDYSHTYSYSSNSSYDTVAVETCEPALPRDWQLRTLDVDDSNAGKLLKWSSDIIPLDYSKPYFIALVATDASREEVLNGSMIDYNYSIIKFITPEHYSDAVRLLDSIN